MCATDHKIPADTGALQQAVSRTPAHSLPMQDAGEVGWILTVKGPAMVSRNKLPLFTEQVQANCRALIDELKQWRVVRFISWIVHAQSKGF